MEVTTGTGTADWLPQGGCGAKDGRHSKINYSRHFWLTQVVAHTHTNTGTHVSIHAYKYISKLYRVSSCYCCNSPVCVCVCVCVTRALCFSASIDWQPKKFLGADTHTHTHTQSHSHTYTYSPVWGYVCMSVCVSVCLVLWSSARACPSFRCRRGGLHRPRNMHASTVYNALCTYCTNTFEYTTTKLLV